MQRSQVKYSKQGNVRDLGCDPGLADENAALGGVVTDVVLYEHYSSI